MCYACTRCASRCTYLRHDIRPAHVIYGHLITQQRCSLSVNADRGAELVAPGRLGDDRRIRSPFCFTPRHSSEEILAQHRAQLVMNYGRPLRCRTTPRLHQTTFDAIWSILTFEIAAANPIDG